MQPSRAAAATQCTARTALSAIGELSGRDATLFAPDQEFFSLLHRAHAGEWLAEHKEEGQPFKDFRWGPRTQRAGQSSKCQAVYLAPLGDFGPLAGDIEFLRRFLEAYLCIPCHVLDSCRLECDTAETNFTLTSKSSDEASTPITSRRNSGTTQLLISDILNALRKSKPEGVCSLLAVTMYDLYPDPKWNFVFGAAQSRSMTACFSFARYNPSFPRAHSAALSAADKHVLLRRAMKVSAHELIHTFGVHHCIYYECLMNGSNHLDEADARPMELCPADLRKMQQVAEFDVAERYEKLQALYKSTAGFEAEAEWMRKRLAHIAQKR